LEQLLQFIIEEALIVIPALWIVGTFLKQTPNVSDLDDSVVFACSWYCRFRGSDGTGAPRNYSGSARDWGRCAGSSAEDSNRKKENLLNKRYRDFRAPKN